MLRQYQEDPLDHSSKVKAKRRFVIAAKEGDKKAFEQLVRQVYPMVWQRVRARTELDSKAHQDEIVQETFVLAFEKLSQLRDADRFEAWVGRIADNQIRKWRRRQARQMELFSDNQDILDTASDLDDNPTPIHPLTIKAQIRAAVRALSEKHRKVIECHYFQRLSYKETADKLCIDFDLVRSRLQKARNQLRKVLVKMDENEIGQEIITLSGNDVEMLQRAQAFCSRDPERDKLHGVLLSPNGRLVATDGRRLLYRKSTRFEKLREPIVLKSQATLRNSVPKPEGQLVLGLNDAVIRMRDRGDLLFEICDQGFPEFEKVFPSGFDTEMQVAGGDWISFLDHIEPYLDAKHSPLNGFKYLPIVRIQGDAKEKRLSLSVNSRLGYSSSDDEDSKETKKLNLNELEWEHRLMINLDSWKGVKDLSFHMNYRFLAEASSALQIENQDLVKLRWSQGELVLELSNSRFADDWALIKPYTLD